MIEIESQCLLTIAIPTYNRLDCLVLSLETLFKQTQSSQLLGHQLNILVCNNASTDGTTEYLDSIVNIYGVQVHHHTTNCGADANILFCCQSAKTKYVWIVGDDDVIVDGAVTLVIDCLIHNKPDLLYLPSLWVTDTRAEHLKTTIASTEFKVLNALRLAAQSSVYVTFISAWIVNLEAYHALAQSPQLDRYCNTSLLQLEWHFTLIKSGSKLMMAKDVMVIARSGCSGGYALFDTFSHQYNRIVDDKFADNPQLLKFYRKNMLWCHIPGLVWGIRHNKIGNFAEFDKAETISILKSAYDHNIFFNLIIYPMIKFNKPVAFCFWFIARCLSKLHTYLNKPELFKYRINFK